MYRVVALYKFTRFDAPADLREPLDSLCRTEGIKGTLLLAPEGINGTIAGTHGGIEKCLAHIRGLPGCADLDWKESQAAEMPFRRTKVRIKREIVTMGQPQVDPAASVGRYVAPEDWNDLIADPEVAVIDTRNAYEVAIGTFEGAINPKTDSFRDFPAWWQANKERFEGKRIAMFCTGGIRCEKSTSFLIGQGVEEVVHLKGGILKYLESVPDPDSSWQGACFVFDERVSVGHGLEPGPHSLCRACRHPLSAKDRARPEYEAGVQCHHCAALRSDADRERYRERQLQVELAERRGIAHIAPG